MSNEIVGIITSPSSIQGNIENTNSLQGRFGYPDYTVVRDKNYLHVQTIASDEWVINHNLNKFPSVSVIDSADNEVIGEVKYIDTNNLKIFFKGSFKGTATLN